MKALSVRQPWAEAMFRGKFVEVRATVPVGRQPRIGERIFIHAGKEWFHTDNKEIRESLLEFTGAPWNSCGWWKNPELTPRGALLGTVTFAGVTRYRVPEHFAAEVAEHWNDPCWFDSYENNGGCVGLRFENPKKLPKPILFKGALGFFEAPFTFADELASVEKGETK